MTEFVHLPPPAGLTLAWLASLSAPSCHALTPLPPQLPHNYSQCSSQAEPFNTYAVPVTSLLKVSDGFSSQ